MDIAVKKWIEIADSDKDKVLKLIHFAEGLYLWIKQQLPKN
ncbi:MAG: hypothetical protein Q8P72_02620 [Candidatus Roizmanbacteria bacterium]|nr:hypothetical protein [Candidatus Roizmanbacteria bacterium]